MANIQAAIGLLQLKHIDAFNEGARQNARALTEGLGDVPGIGVPRSITGDHIYVYYPLALDPQKRDDLRRFLLKHGIDSKPTDMSNCSMLKPFRKPENSGFEPGDPTEASILEICVYPVISRHKIQRIAEVVRTWAGLPKH